MEQPKQNNKFMEFISPRFNKIKDTFSNRISNLGLYFDDDVFSQTIIQCNTKLMNCEQIDEEMIWYFWKAFKNNTLRELQYTRNRTTDEIPEDIIDEEKTNIDEIFNEVTCMIINQFGEELYKLFVLHANGTPYNELAKLSDLNLKYQFRKIREYVRANYERED